MSQDQEACSDCAHTEHAHTDPDGVLGACTVCPCPEFWGAEEPQTPGQLETFRDPYGPASSQVMTPEQVSSDDDRALKAQQLLVAGHSWPEIASMTGYPSSTAAQVSVRAFRQRAALRLSDEQREEILELEMTRLNEMIKSYWPTAMAGEVKHAEFVLKVIAQQSRMLGLEELHTKATQQGTKTIIVAGNEQQYAAALRELVES